MVDGIQLAQINTEASAIGRFEVNDQAEVIEVYGSDQKGSLLLATHLLNFVGPKTQNFSITTESGQQISFSIDLLRDAESSPAGAQVAVEIKEAATAAAAQRIWASISDFFQASAMNDEAIRLDEKCPDGHAEESYRHKPGNHPSGPLPPGSTAPFRLPEIS